jgi:hypothetical protein
MEGGGHGADPPLPTLLIADVLGVPLLAGRDLLGREYALVHRPRLSNETRPLKCRLRNELYDVAHDVRSKAQ